MATEGMQEHEWRGPGASTGYEPTARGRRRDLAKGLGWLSLALGAAQVAAPGRLGEWVGTSGSKRERATMRLVGLRELATGLGILAHNRPHEVLWTRAAGDAMDLVLLGTLLRARGAGRARASMATLGVLGLTALDVMGSSQLGRRGARMLSAMSRPVTAKQSITVNRSPEDVYRFWRDLEGLPRFMTHLQSVEVKSERLSTWTAHGPGRTPLSWDAEIVEDRANELIAWRSIEGSDVHTEGKVMFRPGPGGRGAEIHLELTYRAPAGRIGTQLAKLFREAPDQKIRDELRAMKQVLETGDVVRSDASLVSGMRAARPAGHVRRAS